jgi:hypothetical protein
MVAQAPTRSELGPIPAAGAEQSPRETSETPATNPRPPDAESKYPAVNGMDPWDSSVSARLSCRHGMLSRVRALGSEWQPPPDDVPSPSGPAEIPPPEPQEPTHAPNEVPPEPNEVPGPSPSEEPQRRAAARVQVGGFACRSSALAPGVAGAPWKRPNLAVAEIVERSRHDRNGPLEVLEPSFDTDLEAQPPPRLRGS